MRLRATSPLLAGWTGEAAITTRHPLSCYGRPVLLIDGEPVGPAQADWAGYQILEATTSELEALRRGYYHFDLEGNLKEHRRPRYGVSTYSR